MPDNTAGIDGTNSIVEEAEGDLFDAPENTVLIHACNCLGSWSAGIAKAFRTKYPAAYKVYDQHCKITPHEKLIGTCQLIPPQRKDYERPATTSLPPSKRRKVEKVDDEGVGQAPTTQRKNWIACLFTSVGYGKSTKKHPGRDKPDVILGNTRKTLVDLREKLLELGIKDKKGEDELDPKVKAVADEDAPGELWSCRFNGGLFAVDWADTRKVLEDEMKGLGKTVLVVRPAES